MPQAVLDAKDLADLEADAMAAISAKATSANEKAQSKKAEAKAAAKTASATKGKSSAKVEDAAKTASAAKGKSSAKDKAAAKAAPAAKADSVKAKVTKLRKPDDDGPLHYRGGAIYIDHKGKRLRVYRESKDKVEKTIGFASISLGQSLCKGWVSH